MQTTKKATKNIERKLGDGVLEVVQTGRIADLFASDYRETGDSIKACESKIEWIGGSEVSDSEFNK